jgi:1,6-anhydro-N-acetylmuramate kinase
VWEHDGAARLIVGLMSGTSADGIDAALCEIAGSGRETRARILHCDTTPYPPDVRAEVLALSTPDTVVLARLCRLSYVLGELFAERRRRHPAAGWSGAGPPHRSHARRSATSQPEASAGTFRPATLQVGEPAVIPGAPDLTVANSGRGHRRRRPSRPGALRRLVLFTVAALAPRRAEHRGSATSPSSPPRRPR